jgi:hypothetical protein
MKTIIAVLVFAVLASPSFAQPHHNKWPASKGHLGQIKKLRADYGAAYLSARFRPTGNPREQEHALCSTAHDFCPDYHGDND